MPIYQSLPEYIVDCGGFTPAGRYMDTTPQALSQALKANRQILVKLSESKEYIEAYEIKPFPCQKLSKV